MRDFELAATAVQQACKQMDVPPGEMTVALDALTHHTQQLNHWLELNGLDKQQLLHARASERADALAHTQLSGDEHTTDVMSAASCVTLQAPRAPSPEVLGNRYAQLMLERTQIKALVAEQESSAEALCSQLKSMWSQIELQTEHYLLGKLHCTPAGHSMLDLVSMEAGLRPLDMHSMNAISAAVVRWGSARAPVTPIFTRLPEGLVLRCFSRLFYGKCANGTYLLPEGLSAAAKLAATARWCWVPRDKMPWMSRIEEVALCSQLGSARWVRVLRSMTTQSSQSDSRLSAADALVSDLNMVGQSMMLDKSLCLIS